MSNNNLFANTYIQSPEHEIRKKLSHSAEIGGIEGDWCKGFHYKTKIRNSCVQIA